MKRFLSLILAALILCSFAACKNAPTPEIEPTAAPIQETAPTSSPAPTPLPKGETTSVMAGSFVSDENNGLWTSLAPMEGMTYVYDHLPEDIGHVYSFLVHNGTVYAAVKDDYFSLDPLRIFAFDPEIGETTLLAENIPGNSTFCLLGEDYLLYMTMEGLQTLRLSDGKISEPLTGVTALLAARNGAFYYTREDNGLYRNNSSLLAEERILEQCPSYWLCPGADTLCALAYNDEGTIAVMEFRAMDGTLLARQPLGELPMGICTDGDRVYVPQESESLIYVYNMADGELLHSIPLPEDAAQCLPLLAEDDALYLQALVDGSFRIFRLHTDGSAPVELAADILV